MSTPDSMPRQNDSSVGLAARAEERFFTMDHVGVVRHFEGIGLDTLVPGLKEVLSRRQAKCEEGVEDVRGLKVYTNIAEGLGGSDMTLWVKATQVEKVGVVVDAKLFHSTADSALADEQLSVLVDELEAVAQRK